MIILENDTTNIPAAACRVCGGWHFVGGMSQHAMNLMRTQGRTGCLCELRRKITNRNAAMVECVDLMLDDSQDLFAVGVCADGYFATWMVNRRDLSSHWGHYRKATRTDARLDMLERAGYKQSSLSVFI